MKYVSTDSGMEEICKLKWTDVNLYFVDSIVSSGWKGLQGNGELIKIITDH